MLYFETFRIILNPSSIKKMKQRFNSFGNKLTYGISFFTSSNSKIRSPIQTSKSAGCFEHLSLTRYILQRDAIPI